MYGKNRYIFFTTNTISIIFFEKTKEYDNLIIQYSNYQHFRFKINIEILILELLLKRMKCWSF